MKKLQIIGNQIKNNTFSYTGKGSFEAIVNKFKTDIINWLEDLIPLKQQISYLLDKTGVEFQKRNYTRILSKILPEQYNEFVSINILVRDSNVVARYYQNEFNLTALYEKLVKDKYLKYPGKYDHYVDFEIFQKFIMTYRDELNASLDIDMHSNIQDIEESRKIPVIPKPNEIEPQNQEESTKDKQAKLDDTQEEFNDKKEANTNWTNLLLGRKAQ
jgi:hypothetical protein